MMTIIVLACIALYVGPITWYWIAHRTRKNT